MDYLIVEVSSPNTPGLRNLHAIERLRTLLTAVQDIPGCNQPIGAITYLVMSRLDGFIATHTTISRDHLTQLR